MNKLRNEKGVTLIILTITIIAMLIITSITINSSKMQLAMKKVNNLYSDIDSIGTKISDYYLKNNSLPILPKAYLEDTAGLKELCQENNEDDSKINPNDNGKYYVIDLSKLDNLTLNNGIEYKKWTTTSMPKDYQDLYIINEVTHQIYYPKGVEYKGMVYFSKLDSTIENVNIITNLNSVETNNQGD